MDLAWKKISAVQRRFVARGELDPYSTCSCQGYYHQPVCVDGEGFVALADGSRVAVKELKEGDCIMTPSPSNVSDRSQHAIISKIFKGPPPQGPLLMVNWEGFLITKYHPLVHGSEWAWPIELATPQLMDVPLLFNFELALNAQHHTMDINGVTVSTLGGYCGDRLFAKWPEGDTIFGRGYWTTKRLGFGKSPEE